MASYHNNQLNVVGLFDSDEMYGSPGLSSSMLASAASDYNGPTDAGNGYFHGHEHAPQVNYGFGSRPVEPERFIAGPRSNQDQQHKYETKFRTEDNTSLIKAKSPTWKRVLQKVKGSLIVKLKVGRRGIDSKHKQPEAHVLSMNSMQPETSMLSMNVANSMQDGAHTLPVNNMFSGMSNPAHWAQSHQPLYQGQLQGMQPTQFVSPATKLYNRNHFVAKNGLFDEYFNIRGTVEELSHLERINTPERNLFLGEDLINMDNQPAMLSREDLSDLHSQGQELQYQSAVSDDMHGLSDLHSQGQELQYQPAIFNNMHGLSDLHSQEHEPLGIPEEDSIDFPSFTNYEAHIASHENYVPKDDVFKIES